MRTADFDFALPHDLIAQYPAALRDRSRLLVLDRSSGKLTHAADFRAILSYLRPGDVLVLNNSRVIPARLRGQKAGTGGEIEILLLEEISFNQWWTLLRPGKRVRRGSKLVFKSLASTATLDALVLEKSASGECLLQFDSREDVRSLLPQFGEIPLPPYIGRAPETVDADRYQTTYARTEGSIAAPTAGLHFTPGLLEQIREKGIDLHEVTLHVGLGTFAPVKAERIEQHAMHEERFSIAPATAQALNAALDSGRRIVAVGTTSVRVLETAAAENDGRLRSGAFRTRIFIYPPYEFRIVGALVTNYHLPQSTLLMLVSAFAAPGETRGRQMVLAAYAEAVRQRYRFFSYGDAMLIV